MIDFVNVARNLTEEKVTNVLLNVLMFAVPIEILVVILAIAFFSGKLFLIGIILFIVGGLFTLICTSTIEILREQEKGKK